MIGIDTIKHISYCAEPQYSIHILQTGEGIYIHGENLHIQGRGRHIYIWKEPNILDEVNAHM